MTVGRITPLHDPSRPTWEQSPRAAEYAKPDPTCMRGDYILVADPVSKYARAVTESMVLAMEARITKLESANAALLAACKLILSNHPTPGRSITEAQIDWVRSAVTLAEGGAK